MYRLEHSVRNYAWGSRTAFARLFGTAEPTEPEAEYWFGTHPASPSTLSDGRSLAELVELPYLLKVLAAEKPLSIQAHPGLAEAQAGYDKENAAGIALDAPERNYKDPNHKPELLLALTDFSALCGFRSFSEAERSWNRLSELVSSFLSGEHATKAISTLSAVGTALAARDYASAVKTILGCRKAAGALVDALVAAAELNPDYISHDLALETALRIAEDFPSDPGVLMALLLQKVDIVPGQAIYLSAGVMHAYLHGVGVEVMACSDNVLRGGLTNKHIDVEELLAISCFDPSPDLMLGPEEVHDQVATFRPDADEFTLQVFHSGTDEPLNEPGPHIVLAVVGSFKVVHQDQSLILHPGQAVFIPAADTMPALTYLPSEDDEQAEENPLAVSVTSGFSH